MDSFKVAIIDSGVDFSHPRLMQCKNSGICIVQDDKNLYYDTNYKDENGHGTAIAAIIHRTVPDIELVAVKLKALNDAVNEKMLCEGIKWCISQANIKIINISLGIACKTPDPELFDLCNEAFEKGIHICASTHNMPGYECYPAYFPSVLGVTSGHIKNKSEYGYIENSNINIVAKGTTQRLAWAHKGYRISSGNSFATAHFSGILAKMKSASPELCFSELNRLIKENAQKNVQVIQYVKSADLTYVPKEIPTEKEGEELFSLQKKISFASRLALFPICEKELRTVVNFSDICPYTITLYYDYPRKLNFFNPVCETGTVKVSSRIVDSDFEKFDTLVVGYFLDQMFDANILFGYELIGKAIRCNKNFIIWDLNVYRYIKEQLQKEENRSYTGQIYMPVVNNKRFDEVMHFRYLPAVSVPVILVAGTSNKQGKITTQMRLKEILVSADYRPAHVSTEPQGAVLGADFVFPYGHQSTVSINEDLWGKFISTALKGVEKYCFPHLILTGTQGMMVPRGRSAYELSNEGVLSSLHYMLGVVPDAVICSINPQDTIEMIRNVTRIIEVFSNAKLLFYVMTPWLREFELGSSPNPVARHKMLTPAEMEEKMAWFQSRLGLPVMDIMNRKNDALILEIIENTFSKEKEICTPGK